MTAQEFREALAVVARSPEGGRVLHHIIDVVCGLPNLIGSADHASMAFLEGRRSVAADIIDALQAEDLAAWHLLQKAALEESLALALARQRGERE